MFAEPTKPRDIIGSNCSMAVTNQSLLSDSGMADCGSPARFNDTSQSVGGELLINVDSSNPAAADQCPQIVTVTTTATTNNQTQRVPVAAPAQDSDFVPEQPNRRHSTTGVGIVHSSPNFHPAINAAERATQRHLRHRQIGSFLRQAADDFTRTTLRESQLRRYSVATMPTFTAERYRGYSETSAQSEPPLSTSLPGDCGVRVMTASSPRHPHTPPPTARVRNSAFVFPVDNVTGLADRLSMFELDYEDDD